jgi:hypothetical protein
LDFDKFFDLAFFTKTMILYMSLIFGIGVSLNFSYIFDSFLFDMFFSVDSTFYLLLFLALFSILHSLLTIIIDYLMLNYYYLNFKTIRDQKKTFYCGLFHFQLNSLQSTRHPHFRILGFALIDFIIHFLDFAPIQFLLKDLSLSET